jgi:hypothetical protein
MYYGPRTPATIAKLKGLLHKDARISEPR